MARPAGMRGLGAFYDAWPAPFNNPMVLLAILAAILIIFGGGFKLFGRRSGSRVKRAQLRYIAAQAEEKKAKLHLT